MSSEEALVHQAEMAAYGDDYKNYQVRLGSETAFAIGLLLDVERAAADVYGMDVPPEEDLFVMLAGRFKDATSASSESGSETVDVDINYRELNAIGDVSVVKGNATIAPYFLDMLDVFVAAGGRDNKRLRAYFEILIGR